MKSWVVVWTTLVSWHYKHSKDGITHFLTSNNSWEKKGKKKSLTFWNMNWCSNNCFSVYDQLPHGYSFYLATTWEINVRIIRACMVRHRKWNNNVKYYCYCNCGIQIKHFQKKKNPLLLSPICSYSVAGSH